MIFKKVTRCQVSVLAYHRKRNFCEKEKLSITNVVAENHDGGTDISLGGTISVNFTATASDDVRLDLNPIEFHDHPASLDDNVLNE